ncbi:MAG: aldo/keto reductase [Lachnospiraceae bacterium]|nr:aldo/keto reductase [Lachnospiraceae bacterium]
MNKRILGTDLEVSAIGLGCMGFSHAYGAPTAEQETIRMLQYAYELGYTFFDTAEVYGTPNDPNANERVVGEALQSIRNHVRIASKFGIRFDYDSLEVNKSLILDARPEVIRMSVEGSLRRLRTDHIDLYYQHRMDPAVEPETVAEVMAELIKEGKVLRWGISEANENYLRRAHAVCPVTTVQNRYSMMVRQHEALFPVLEELKIGFVAFSPMANGFLTGKYGKDENFDKKYDYRSNMPQFTAEAVEQNQELLTMLREIAKEHGASPAQISMAWMLCKKPWIVPIPGTRKPERLKENAGAAEVYLSPEEVADLDDLLDQIPMSAVFGGSSVKTGRGQCEVRTAASRQ